MGNAQDQAHSTEKFQQNQAIFRKDTAVDGSLKNQVLKAVELVCPYPLAHHLTGFGQFSTLNMLQHLFSSYSKVDEINLEKHSVKMMGPYNPP